MPDAYSDYTTIVDDDDDYADDGVAECQRKLELLRGKVRELAQRSQALEQGERSRSAKRNIRASTGTQQTRRVTNVFVKETAG
jgi:hypothetical protein